MKKKIIIFKSFLLTLLISAASINAQDVKPLFDLEKQFCSNLNEVGYSAAFLNYIDDEGIMFLPQPAGGKDYLAAHKNDFKGLFWEAGFAEMSLNGDFGYTTGPWHSVRKDDKGNEITSYGHFVTVWNKVKGNWKFLIDCGISYNKSVINNTPYTEEKVQPAEDRVLRFPFEDLIKIDNDFNFMADEKGLIQTYEKYASPNIRFYRNDFYPAAGIENGKKIINQGKLDFFHMGGKAAPAGDFAFTYGTAGVNDDGSPTFNYMRIWKKEGKDWKIVLDLLTPVKK